MQIFINNNSFLDIKDIPLKFENFSKDVVIESCQDIEDLIKLKNVKSMIIMGLDEKIKSIDLSNFKDLESIQVSYNFGLEKIEGLTHLSKLSKIYYPKQEADNYYNSLCTNILEQIDLSIFLSRDSSFLLLSVFSIPILREKYFNFFDDFKAYSNKILFGDSVNSFLQGEVYSPCTFTEAYEADSIIDKWILENISSNMTNIEKFARIYKYVLGINYDLTADENKENYKIACSTLQTLLRGKGICVGYAQLLKYICLKCDLQCEYVQACLKDNYNIVSNEGNTFLEVIPKEKNKLTDFIVPNHAIARFSPDGVNWLFCDPTNDSLFVRLALNQNKKLKKMACVLFNSVRNGII